MKTWTVRVSALGLLALGASSLSVAEPIQWRVQLAGQREPCIASDIRLYIPKEAATPGDNFDRYLRDADSFRHHLRPTGVTWSRYIPVSEITEIKGDVEGRSVASYEITLKSGEVIGSNTKMLGKKVLDPMVAACWGDLNPDGTENPEHCPQNLIMQLTCMSVETGEKRPVFATTLVRSKPQPGESPGHYRVLQSAVRISDDEWAAIPAKIEATRAARAAEAEAKSQKRQEGRLAAQTRAQEDFQRWEQWIKTAAVGTYAFCESDTFLLTPGRQPTATVADLLFKCDVHRNASVRLKPFLENGWELVSETRTPEEAWGGARGYAVSLTLRKVK